MVIAWLGVGWAAFGEVVLVRLDYGKFVGLVGLVDLVRYHCCPADLVWCLRLLALVLSVP
jgi:hypothetical protein